MKVLLTGCEGFTGRHLSALASARGHEVVALRANLCDAAAVESEVAKAAPEAAVHLAGISFVGHTDERAFYDVNLFGTLNLLAALKKTAGVRKVLLASSANVYGDSEHSPLAETEPIAPVNHYAASKAAMEFLARARSGKMPLVITRPFNYTGIGQSGSFVIPKLIDHFVRRLPQIRLGNLRVEREYNDVRFVCAAYLQLLEADAGPGTYNICSGITYDLATVLAVLREITGHPIEVLTDPGLVRPNEIRRLCGDPDLLQRTVGTLPRPSLRETLSWMLAAAQ